MIQDKVREHPFSPSESIHAIFSKTAFPLIELWKIALHPLFIGVTQFSGLKNWGMSRFLCRLYSSSKRAVGRLESFDRFICHESWPMPSAAENTLSLP